MAVRPAAMAASSAGDVVGHRRAERLGPDVVLDEGDLVQERLDVAGLRRRAVGQVEVHLVQRRVEDGQHGADVARAHELDRDARRALRPLVVQPPREQVDEDRLPARVGALGQDRRLRVRLLGRDEVHRVVRVEVDEHAAATLRRDDRRGDPTLAGARVGGAGQRGRGQRGAGAEGHPDARPGDPASQPISGPPIGLLPRKTTE